ncbi:DUF58 domain-containing protein [Streptomyces sp. HNM0574]|uniref:DUF58 domain-containing protein n=1 Tax=Streptomyces sp. HNM0574 TaxID=2714954 RepID=UPI001469C29D|nr:DUF58 domain-containing protein [Streptomyces sp. HNM0574]NLU67638.1 DUF58 domain-containing protein [Streptomyces sp. HNM0574]
MAGGPGPAEAPASGPARDGLRGALGGLTTRGRSFLAAGVAAAVCAYVLGQTDLLRVGLLLAALPLVCVLVLHRTRHRVAGSRGLSPGRVPAGAESRVRLSVENVSRLPTGLLMLQDRVPYVLGPRPRFMVDRIEPGGRREVSYRVRSDLRGRYPLGPLELRLTDPFGMCEMTRAFSPQDALTVVPRTESLPPVRLPGGSAGHGDGRQGAPSLAGDDDVIPRGYRRGDDLRRVHWRSTARHGELMVRREEQPRQARCTLLLDTRRVAYAGSGPGSPFEWAVSGAASVALHLHERGYAVRLMTEAGPAVPGPEGGLLAGSGADAAGLLLDTLAAVEHSAEPGLERAVDLLRHGAGGPGETGPLLAFLGTLDEAQATALAGLRHRTGHAVAFVAGLPDAEGPPYATGGPGGGSSPVDATAAPAHRTLREAGWTVLAGGPGRPLGDLWRHIGDPTLEGLR